RERVLEPLMSPSCALGQGAGWERGRAIRGALGQRPLGSRYTIEFIPINGPRCFQGKEAPALTGGPCTGLQSCLPTFRAITSVTVDALQRLVPSFEAALRALMACCDALNHFRLPLTP